MSRDISIRKLTVDPLSISLPYMYLNPQFGYSIDTIIRYVDGSPDCVLKPDAFPYGIQEYYWIYEGAPGIKSWYALGCIEEGLYFFYKAYTHTMFDKDGHMELWVSHKFSDIIEYAMDTVTYTLYNEESKQL